MIQSSFQKWETYLREKKLTFGPETILIHTKTDLRPACKGDEDLKFYFGTEDEAVKNARAKFSHPFGFSELTTPGDALQPEWGRGFIWIAGNNSVFPKENIPTWSSARDALAGLILHEVGHVFGNGHVDGITMTEKIGLYLENDTKPSATPRFVGRYDQIDSQIELVPCMTCHSRYEASQVFDPVKDTHL